jgi:ribosomal-protein-alanine N-acetyltransferase
MFTLRRPSVPPATPQPPPHVRHLTRRDFPAFLPIDRASFPDPWSEDDFLALLRQRDCIGMVAEPAGPAPGGDGVVVGYMVYRYHPGSVELLRMGVDPAHRRRGVGRAMAARLAGKLAEGCRTAVTLRVRETAGSAVRFFAAQGFRATGLVRGHYADTGEDAYAMEYRLGG